MAAQEQTLTFRRYMVLAAVVAVALTAAAMWLAFTLFNPTPPRSVAMAVEPGASSAELGKRYREILARDGIELRLVPAVGAVENVALLDDRRSGVSIAIVPSGITDAQRSPDLLSLGTLFYEPLWLFYRSELERKGRARETLRGKRISIGPEGSGAHALSLEFFARVGVIDQRDATLLSLSPQVATGKLIRGEIDAAILLDAWESPLVHRLLSADNVSLASIPTADAFVALYPYLSKVVLPAGVGDMARIRPPTDTVLLSPKASLVVRNDLHPAIQYLLLEAATQVHSRPGVFNKAGQFPAPESIDLPLSEQAMRFYKTGRPFLQRYLPFWLAVLAQQMLVLLIPLIAVLYPLLRFLPALYAWAMRRRVFRLYNELKAIEDQVLSARAQQQPAGELIAALDRLETRASQFRVPVSFRPLLYALRLHIALVREALERR
ncbi:MAG TPA: TAXI family TRAP transporter solute-binding subunit [Burkholderiales bacterium]|nr:TAXI family TRAP transporter solute-binding subunit [Burkholderiales bacterium]